MPCWQVRILTTEPHERKWVFNVIFHVRVKLPLQLLISNIVSIVINLWPERRYRRKVIREKRIEL